MSDRPPSLQSYRERAPHPALTAHVACVWVQRVAAGSAPYRHRTVPNGSAELVVPVGTAPRIAGPRTGPAEDVLAPGAVVVGVRFRPGAGAAVLGMPAAELVDRAPEARELWGAGAGALGERVADAASPGEAATLVEAEVLARLARARVADPDPIAGEAVRLLLPWWGAEVGALTPVLHLSERHLRRRLAASVGLPPKALQRILRFQVFLALARARGWAGGELARLAAAAGYADQPHLTRESVRLAGLPPGELFRESRRSCGPEHDHAASYGPLLRSRALRSGPAPG